jgi:hypothetical protein
LRTSLPSSLVLETTSHSTPRTARPRWNIRLRHILVHAVPRLRAAATTISALLLHAALLLLFVFLLLERELVLRGVSWTWSSRSAGAHHTCVSALLLHHHLLHLHWVHAAGAAAHHVLGVRGPGVAVHATAHHLRLHLLHLHWVHTAHAAHGVGHATAGLLLGKVLLHLLEVLLHALPVLGHHGRCHACIAALGLLILLIVIAGIPIVAVVAIVELVVATELLVAAIVVAHVASGLGTLNFDGFAEDLQRLAESCVDGSITVKSDEAEATRSTSLLVHHEGSVDNSTELLEELGEVLLGCFLADTTNKDLAGTLLLFSGNGTLGIDLVCVSMPLCQKRERLTILPSR